MTVPLSNSPTMPLVFVIYAIIYVEFAPIFRF